MEPTTDPARELAHRLRALRERHWPEVKITQLRLADALRVSVPLISSWENSTRPAVPPPERLDAYARFFATSRSVAGAPFRLLSYEELTADERSGYQQLRQQLLALRDAALAVPAGHEPGKDNPWHFGNQHRITIVCAQLPAQLRQEIPLANPDSPDYAETYTYADLDALLELHGHLRAVNPASVVNIRVADDLDPDRYTDHLVLLGGVDWNSATEELLSQLDLPVTQQARESDPDGWFEVAGAGEPQQFRPVLRAAGGRRILVEDIAHFFRGPNPFNGKRTVTICNGMFGRGTLGAVRALTDERFRDRNTDYIGRRFRGGTVSILSRVHIARGAVLTPDWTRADTRLHEWPEEAS